jgi:hypothetical protein
VVVQSGKESYLLSVIALMLGAWFGAVSMCAVLCCFKRKAAALARKGEATHSLLSALGANYICLYVCAYPYRGSSPLLVKLACMGEVGVHRCMSEFGSYIWVKLVPT